MTTVSGILRDAKGMALPGVAVTLRYVPAVIGYSGGAVAQNNLTYLTSSTGLLAMPGLVAGPYDLSIAMPIGTSAAVTAAVTARLVVNGEAEQTLEDALQTTIGEVTPTILSLAIAAADRAEAAAAAAALFDPDNFQPKDATLTSIAALGTAPGKIAYTTGVDTWAEAAITTQGRALLDDADAEAQRATLGLGAAATAGFLDEDNFASNSATAAPSQQSTKAYVDAAIPAKLNASGSAPIYACRAWVNFNGAGTPVIRAAGNVSSITDNGVGDYTVNFTAAMQDANYAVSGSVTGNFGGASLSTIGVTTNWFRIATSHNGGAFDPDQVHVAIFR